MTGETRLCRRCGHYIPSERAVDGSEDVDGNVVCQECGVE